MTDELTFGDEVENNLCDKVGGTLSFSNPTQVTTDSETSHVRSWSRASRLSNEQTKSPSSSKPKKIIFDIISAHTINNPGKKKYVSYTILVKLTPGLDNNPAVIERRYTDFLNLYQNLKKSYANLVRDLAFPRKALLGNFTADIITERSGGFHSFLTFINEKNELRNSLHFSDFLHYKEIRSAQKLMKQGSFEDAVPLLENSVFLQQKFNGEKSYQVFWTLCLLISCLNSAENLTDAQRYANIALQLTDDKTYQDSPLYLPLLQLSIHLWWSLGLDKKDLEERLNKLNSTEHCSRSNSLLDAVIQQQFPF